MFISDVKAYTEKERLRKPFITSINRVDFIDVVNVSVHLDNGITA
jgi:hypothetical protein